MLGIFEKLRSTLVRRAFNRVFGVRLRERFCRQEFFYNAFKALSFNGIDGDYVEFGCHSGGTFALAYHEAVRHRHKGKMWAFDSFCGLPAQRDARDSHPAWIEKGLSTNVDRFHKLCASRSVPRDAYEVVPGFYEDSLGSMPDDQGPMNIALAYVDCDMYSSTMEVLRFLRKRLKHGMIVAFDDYFCWSATQISGERAAMLGTFSDDVEWRLMPYMQFGWHGLSFVVESKKLTGRS